MSLLKQNAARLKSETLVKCKRTLIAVCHRYDLCRSSNTVEPRHCTAEQLSPNTVSAKVLLHKYRIDLAAALRRDRADAVSHVSDLRGDADQFDPKLTCRSLAQYPLLSRLKHKGRSLIQKRCVVGAEFLPENSNGINAVRTDCPVNECGYVLSHWCEAANVFEFSGAL